ncbi:uncharacterized protein A1O5_08488 [Cladophialophora psammophila CBS 110553]|uniref:Uncharacterized protein n=1 Tax=Cladophialophora psammophila CBS 110553 TaxID=1182543 RepID=W9XE38_9EURO|nr:uncharacterized protein A1O5_08488 [Cladophialophora psammophila CBS 110553]EXJ68694.1 hypothetical protein A1O5_08488 [Cladophialophora psammophila CBS 110553]
MSQSLTSGPMFWATLTTTRFRNVNSVSFNSASTASIPNPLVRFHFGSTPFVSRDRLTFRGISGTDRFIYEGVSFMADLIASDGDSLQELHPRETHALIRAVERVKELHANVLKHGPLGNPVNVDPDFPWWQDFPMLNLVDS